MIVKGVIGMTEKIQLIPNKDLLYRPIYICIPCNRWVPQITLLHIDNIHICIYDKDKQS